MLYRFFKVKKDCIHLLKGIFESYEGMCILSTVDRDNAIVQFTIAPDFEKDIAGAIDELKDEFGMRPVHTDIHHSLGKF